MSKYTTEVRYICEYYAGLTESVGGDDVDDVVEAARSQIFENYPIFDEEYRGVLEDKILRHYYTREIGYETVGLWRLHLNNKMNEIMPYYNKLYESAELEFNPFNDVDYSISHAGTENNSETDTNTRTLNTQSVKADTGTVTNQEGGQTATTGTDSGSGSNQTIEKYSDTPQGGITGLLGDDTSGQQYLTSARVTNGSNSSSGNSSSTTTHGRSNTETLNTNERTTDTGTVSDAGARSRATTDSYINRITGKIGTTSYSKLLKEYRDTLINIDMKIIKELEDLFFTLW